ncbi:hypothetical protein [Winogradskyella sp. SYSU M77433]|uniref:hypothetical protein n=1 Tax=Winogradskyella sp. SYSU M77433 TaxID=3042722 RepID=UPI0024813607|nr:hypothetical protein [Winogradskyella sp. SYSU M77433]MDH7913206.1 hypothetical protein [Winogradskyella sp. SYSU M77433]
MNNKIEYLKKLELNLLKKKKDLEIAKRQLQNQKEENVFLESSLCKKNITKMEELIDTTYSIINQN